MDAIRRLLGHYRYASIALVTVLTLAIVGAVVLTTTSAGCGPANALKIKTTRCVSTSPVANRGLASPSPQKFTPFAPPPSQQAPPTNTPSTTSAPPFTPPASANSPFAGPSSSGAPPMAWPGSDTPGPSATFSCRLPIYAGSPGSGGFVVLPGQSFVADPRSAVVAPSVTPGASPSPGPGYPGQALPAGWYGLSYDARYTRWLPVPYAWTSPDGKRYAYPQGGEIYVQDVADGTQQELGQGHGFTPVNTENDGVYVTSTTSGGLWFLPYSGDPKQIAQGGFWQVVTGGAAYGSPTSQVPQGASNEIDRLDLASGGVSKYFSEEGGLSTALGADSQGHPVIVTNFFGGNGSNGGQAVFIATAPNKATVIASVTYGYGPYGPMPQGTPIADSHGLWFSVGNGVVMYANGQWYAMAAFGGQLAGPCS